MSSFHLSIVTPDGLYFDGQAERLTVRTTEGEVTILPRHINYVAALGMGAATVVVNGEAKKAACIGGMLSMLYGEAKLIATTFEWADQIDLPRAQAALARAEKKLADESLDRAARRPYEAARRRAQVRISVSEMQ